MPKNMKKASGRRHSHSPLRPPPRLSARKSPLQERSQVTVDAILQGASQVLVKVGYERANTTLIAKAAGVSVGSLYQYYPNKDAVFSALLQRHLAETLTRMRDAVAATAHEPLERRIRKLVGALCAYKAENPRLHRVLKSELGRIDGAKPVRRLLEESHALVETTLRDHQRELPLADPARAAFLAVNAVEGIVAAALLELPEGLGAPGFAHELADAVVGMLRSMTLTAAEFTAKERQEQTPVSANLS
jgi:AcrR family transcriptional regulator